MSDVRSPIPEGPVSTIRGRWQAPGLTWIVRFVLVLGVASALLPGGAGTAAAVVAVAVVIATPLLRVAWLVLRWYQEGDRRFVLLGLALLAVVGAGALAASLGVGR